MSLFVGDLVFKYRRVPRHSPKRIFNGVPSKTSNIVLVADVIVAKEEGENGEQYLMALKKQTKRVFFFLHFDDIRRLVDLQCGGMAALGADGEYIIPGTN